MRKPKRKTADTKTGRINKKSSTTKKNPSKARSYDSTKGNSYSEEKAFVLWTTMLNNSLG